MGNVAHFNKFTVYKVVYCISHGPEGALRVVVVVVCVCLCVWVSVCLCVRMCVCVCVRAGGRPCACGGVKAGASSSQHEVCILRWCGAHPLWHTTPRPARPCGAWHAHTQMLITPLIFLKQRGVIK